MVPTTRSARDTLSKKTVPSIPIAGTRKSERLEKKTQPSLAAEKGNSGKKKTVVVTPLRRSERMTAKNLSSSASASHSSTTSSPSKGSTSKSSGSSSSSGSKANPKKKRKCVKKLSVEEEKEEGSEEEERDVESDSKVNSKRLNARVYRASFNKPEEDCHEESNKMDKSIEEGGNNGSSKMPKDGILPSEDAKAKEMTAESRLSGPVEELVENNATLGSLVPSNATNHEPRLASEDAKAKETTAESRLSGPVKDFLGKNVTLGSLVPSNATNHEARLASEWNQSDCHGEETSQMLVSRNLMRAESRLSGPAKELSENNATLGSLVPSNATNHESGGAPESDQSDRRRKETSQMLLSANSVLNENLIQNFVGHEKGENLISSKRKGTMMDMHSDVSATLVDDENCNLIVDADPSRLCGNTAGTNRPCSKRIRRISLSDVQSDQRELINSVDQLSSEVEGVKLSTGNKEDEPQGNDVEYIRKQQRSLHLLLKPEIAKLCEILLLPDNVKKMADHCLDYFLNNRQICTKPVSILQAFQLSLCWTAASLLEHKLDFEASIKLAKRHLNFSCKKDVVGVIYSRLWELKEEILLHTGNHDVIDSPKASESSDRVYSYTEVASEVDLANKDTPKSTKGIQKCENRLRKLLLMQQEEKQKLKADIEKEKADFERRYKIEGAAIRCCSPNDGMRREKLLFFSYEYDKRVRELKRQHEIRLKNLEAKQLNAMQTFNNIVEAMTRTGYGVGLSKSPDSNSPGVCSSPVEVQTPPVRHAGANEMEIMASEDVPVSRNKCHSIDENEYESQGNIISKDSNCRGQRSGGAASTAHEGQGCESRNGCGQDTVTLVQLSSNGEICDRETSDVPNGEVALAMRKASNQNDDQDEVPSSRKEKLDGTILSMPVCENAAQIHEADDSNDSNNGGTPTLRSSDERVASLNLKSAQEHVHGLNAMCLPNSENSAEIYEGVDGSGSNNAVTLNSPLTDERIAAGAIVCVSDREVHVEVPGTVNFSHCPENVTAVNPPSSMQQISEGAVNVSVLDKELSRPCGTASPSNGPDANAITILNQPSLEKQNPDGVSSSIPAGQVAVEVPETSHEEASVTVSDRESPVGMLSSPMDQISDGGSVLDGILSSRPCGASSSSNGLATIPLPNIPSSQQQIPDRISLSIPDGQISVVVPETSHEVAECQLTDTMNTSTTTDQQQGVPTMTENTLPQEAPVSRPVDITEPLEQVQPLSSVQSPPDPDTAREMQNSLVSGPVDIVPANLSNHASLVVEPTEQMRQLPCAELLSSNQDPSNLPLATGVEHQRTNEDTLSSHVPEASIEVPNQAVEQRASNLDLDSPMPGGVRTQSSDTRNLSTPSQFNNHIQTAIQSASRTTPPLSLDPLKYELERIRKLAEKNLKNHEDTKLQLKSDYEKELEELRRKYEVKFHDAEVEFQQQRKDLDTCFKTVLLNKALAEALRYKWMDHKVPGASGMQQDATFTQQLLQLIAQQNAPWCPPVAGSSSCAPPAASLQSSYTTTSSQTAVPPPTRPAYNTSGIFSSVSARPLHTNSIPSPPGNFQASGEIRSPAPHLQPYRPSMSVPTVPPRGMPSQPVSGGIPVTPPSYSGRPPLQLPKPNQPDPRKGPSPVSTGGLPTPSLYLRKDSSSQSGINMPNTLPRLSHLASLDRISRSGTSSSRPANSSLQATSSDVVCLSDDE